jgi:oligopeptidase B
MKLFVALLACLMSALTSPAQFELVSPKAPAPEKRPKDVTVHEDPRVDDYFWLREKENPEVRNYLEQENAYTESILAPARALRAQLFAEMRGRIKEDDSSAPVPYLGWRYYSRTEKDKQYPIYCRVVDRPDAAEEVLLDLNKLGEGRAYVALGHYRVSNDGSRLAYSIDWTGYRQYEVFVMDLATKQLVPQQIGKVSDLEWGATNDVLYFVTENESKRSDKVHRWTISTAEHELLLEEADELFNVELLKSQDSRWLFVNSESKITAQPFGLRAADHRGRFAPLLPRVENEKHFVEHHEGSFYFVTNRGAVNYQIVRASVSSPQEWSTVVPHNPAVRIGDGLMALARYLVWTERENGLPHIRVHEFATGQSRRLEMPEAAYEVSVGSNWNYDTDELRFNYQSMVRPTSVFAMNLLTGDTRLIKQQAVLGGFDPTNYKAERVWVTARDGTRIPLSIVYRADLDRSQPRPFWLYAYGSYGISMPVAFSSNRLSLLDRGFIFAIAHIRGGGELGEEWRLAGRMAKKMTTFNDFVDCAEWLVERRWTTPQQLVISGGSAGGLLMGAVLNQRPDLFQAALVVVPFVDVLNTMLDASLPLTTEEYVEWGNPNIREEYFWMRAYSPYDNLKPAHYPHVLVNTSFYDSQVPYWEGAKYLAKMRDLHQGGDRALLLRTLFGAGHGGASGRYDALHDVARDYSFFLSALGQVPQDQK